MLLDAVREEAKVNKYGNMDEFILRVAERLGERADVSHWLECAEEQVNRGYLKDERTQYALTPSGQQLLGEHKNGCSREVAEVSSIPVAPESADTCISAADILINGKDKLARLLSATDEIGKARTRQCDLRKEIGEKRAELELLEEALKEEVNREAALIQGVDVKALAALLGG